MEQPGEPEDNEIAIKIMGKIFGRLSSTPYALDEIEECASGGTTNFVFRGTLLDPLPTDEGLPATTVIIKHATDFLQVNPAIKLNINRCGFEAVTLKCLPEFPTSSDLIIKVPRIWDFFYLNGVVDTLVIEDFCDTADLKTILFSHNASEMLPDNSPQIIGRLLGRWLQIFHHWASTEAETQLFFDEFGQNPSMRELMNEVKYDPIIPILENYPELLAGCKEDLKKAVDAMKADIERGPGSEGGSNDQGWGLIHGDFWSGNVLLHDSPWKILAGEEGDNALFIIDWEFAQFGHRGCDLGHIIGDLYERNLFNNIEIAIPMLKGVIEGYGEVSEDIAFRTMSHAGAELVTWYRRLPKSGSLYKDRDTVVSGLAMGRDMILKAWARDRTYFEQHPVMAPLFQKKV